MPGRSHSSENVQCREKLGRLEGWRSATLWESAATEGPRSLPEVRHSC